MLRSAAEPKQIHAPLHGSRVFGCVEIDGSQDCLNGRRKSLVGHFADMAGIKVDLLIDPGISGDDG